MIKTLICLFALALIAVAGVALYRGGFRDTAAEPLAPMVSLAAQPDLSRTPAPAFQLIDDRGTAVSLASFRGEVVVLNFFATWCPTCRSEVPALIEWNQTFAARGLRVIGISVDEDWDADVVPFLAERRITYPVLRITPEVHRAYQIERIPTTVLVDHHGRVAFRIVGFDGGATIAAEIERLLGERDRALAAARSEATAKAGLWGRIRARLGSPASSSR